MRKILSLNYGLDTVLSTISVLSAAAVVQTFVIGQHYIIPTMLLVLAVFTGNLALYGFQDHRWAKVVNFWIGVVLSGHFLFALFWSKRYREILGGSFEVVTGGVFVLLAVLTVLYARRNRLC